MAQYAIYAGVAVLASGQPAAFADITVRRASDNAVATIYSDEAGANVIAQPGFQTDANGRFAFYAPGSTHGYNLTITKGAESVTLNNQAIGTAAQYDAGAFGVQLLATTDLASAQTLLGLNATYLSKLIDYDRLRRRARLYAAQNLV